MTWLDIALIVVVLLIIALVIIDAWVRPIPFIRKIRGGLGVAVATLIGILVGRQTKKSPTKPADPESSRIDPVEHENVGDGLDEGLENTREELNDANPVRTDPDDFPADDPDDLARADEWARRRRSDD